MFMITLLQVRNAFNRHREKAALSRGDMVSTTGTGLMVCIPSMDNFMRELSLHYSLFFAHLVRSNASFVCFEHNFENVTIFMLF